MVKTNLDHQSSVAVEAGQMVVVAVEAGQMVVVEEGQEVVETGQEAVEEDRMVVEADEMVVKGVEDHHHVKEIENSEKNSARLKSSLR